MLHATNRAPSVVGRGGEAQSLLGKRNFDPVEDALNEAMAKKHSKAPTAIPRHELSIETNDLGEVIPYLTLTQDYYTRVRVSI
jgi:hypothetical protein